MRGERKREGDDNTVNDAQKGTLKEERKASSRFFFFFFFRGSLCGDENSRCVFAGVCVCGG